MEAEPTKSSAQTKVTALLQDLLHGDPASVEELRRLLAAQGGVQAITQTTNVKRHGNKVVQLAGSGNSVRIG